MHFESRMSDSDALMWTIEKDPILRSTITAVAVLDRCPDRETLLWKIDRGTRLIPRMRQRVVGMRPGESQERNQGPIVGDPIGTEGLREDLRHEMIPYTPEELIAIAEREYAFDIEGDLVYVTAVDGAPALRRPIRVRVVHGDDDAWRIAEWNYVRG